MAHDRKGVKLKAGDEVTIRATVTEVDAEKNQVTLNLVDATSGKPIVCGSTCCCCDNPQEADSTPDKLPKELDVAREPDGDPAKHEHKGKGHKHS